MMSTKQLQVVDTNKYIDPAPINADEAERFLRRECKLVIEIAEETDIFKVTCSAADPDGEKGRCTQEKEIVAGTIRLPSKVMLELAGMMHSWRKQLQTGELQSK
jgi:hypothetical protein